MNSLRVVISLCDTSRYCSHPGQFIVNSPIIFLTGHSCLQIAQGGESPTSLVAKLQKMGI